MYMHVPPLLIILFLYIFVANKIYNFAPPVSEKANVSTSFSKHACLHIMNAYFTRRMRMMWHAAYAYDVVRGVRCGTRRMMWYAAYNLARGV